MRETTLNRKTAETDIQLRIRLDAGQSIAVRTGVGFFDHMLHLAAFHGGFDLTLEIQGDTHIDDHHTVEDAGIVLGTALRRLIGEGKDIARYGHSLLPMDEVLARAVIDVSGRACLSYTAAFSTERIGDLAVENIREFFAALVRTSGITLHLDILKPGNAHHQAEALFKSFGRALRMALARNSNQGIPSTKGVLGEEAAP